MTRFLMSSITLDIPLKKHQLSSCFNQGISSHPPCPGLLYHACTCTLPCTCPGCVGHSKALPALGPGWTLSLIGCEEVGTFLQSFHILHPTTEGLVNTACTRKTSPNILHPTSCPGFEGHPKPFPGGLVLSSAKSFRKISATDLYTRSLGRISLADLYTRPLGNIYVRGSVARQQRSCHHSPKSILQRFWKRSID